MVSKAPLVLSLVLHAAGVAWMGSGHAPAGTTASTDTTIDVEIAAPELAPAPTAAPARASSVAHAAPPTHHHPYPVATDHDAHPHDPAIEHEHARLPDAPADAPAPAPAVVASPEPVARFVLSGAINATTSAPVRFAAANGTGAGKNAGAGGDGAAASEVVAESQVSVGARLVARANVAYPAAARASEIEADVPVEIVLDTSGRVVEARALGHVGYGLDEAAVVAVRGYRFTAALREGRPVRVRMRWRVEFRLR